MSSSDAPATPDPTMILNATMIDRRDQNEYLAVVKIQPDGGVVPYFRPGQFCTLGLPRPPRAEEIEILRQRGKEARPRLIRRAYSIVSSPEEREYVELFVILVSEGKLTPKLWDIAIGERLWMHEEIKGEFTLDGVPADRDLIMFSTGTGIAPFISMYRTFCGTNRWRSYTVINGVRHAVDLGYVEELSGYARADKHFSYLPVVSRSEPGDQWEGLKGRVNMLLEGDLYHQQTGRRIDPETSNVFLCGNPAMIDGVAAALQKRGFSIHSSDNPEGNLHFERYW